MTSPMASIIVPVYNAEKYLCECIESVLSLSRSEWELILIDDGSVDNSAEICKRYALKDRRVHYYYQKNAGVSAARNTGMNYATGSWITFLDADDCLMTDALKIIQYANEGTDFVIFGYSRENGKQPFNANNHELDRKDTQQSILNIRKFINTHTDIHAINGYNNWSCWGRFFKRTIITSHNILFPVGLRRSEDLLFCLQYTGYIRKTLVNETIGYYYRTNPESVTQKYADYLEDNTTRVIKEASRLATGENLNKELSAFVMNNLTKCCTDYYLHPQNSMPESEKVRRLQNLCKQAEVKRAIKNCNYKDIALGKKNTIQNIVLLWLLRRRWYKSAFLVLKIVK